MNTPKFLALVLLLCTASLVSLAATSRPMRAAGDYLGDPYPLDTCAACEKKLSADAVTVVLAEMKDHALDGTQLKCCNAECVESFKANSAKSMNAVHAAILKLPNANYPLKNCVMMRDEVLDDTAKSFVYQNRVFKVCCKKCVMRFGQDPAKHAKEWEALVIEAQKASYPLKTCVVSGKPIEGEGVWVVVQNRAFHLCCPGCVSPVRADPAKFAAKLQPVGK
ncbi:MAG: hypothetical protein EXS10_06995 [Phycisphaerales bacterium]|nr:hypothetical protein [Phycisphaerales bacterium]